MIDFLKFGDEVECCWVVSNPPLDAGCRPLLAGLKLNDCIICFDVLKVIAILLFRTELLYVPGFICYRRFEIEKWSYASSPPPARLLTF